MLSPDARLHLCHLPVTDCNLVNSAIDKTIVQHVAHAIVVSCVALNASLG